MIYQDFALVPQLTVAQNIFLGRELYRRAAGLRILDKPAMDRRSRKLFVALGQQQAVAIARATGLAAKLVIIDEPTANLGAPAIAKARETIPRLKASRIAVMLIGHRLEYIFTVGDRFVVMKHGRTVASRKVGDTHQDEFIEMIVTGREPTSGARPVP